MERTQDLTGGCLCGAILYRYHGPLGGELGLITLCHCSQCRRVQGYAAAAAPALAAGFEIMIGAGLIREYASSPGKKRAFCSVCGSPLYSRRDADPAALRLRLGSLDSVPPGLTIQAHIFTEDMPAWTATDTAARYKGPEPGRI